jgi:hypothetical protein
VSTIEELLGRKSIGSGLEIREYGRRDPSRWPRDTLYPQKLALTSPTSRGRSVGIVRLRTQATELSFSFSLLLWTELQLSIHFIIILNLLKIRSSSVGIATGYGLDDLTIGVRVPVVSIIFTSPHGPDRLWGPPILL